MLGNIILSMASKSKQISSSKRLQKRAKQLSKWYEIGKFFAIKYENRPAAPHGLQRLAAVPSSQTVIRLSYTVC